MKRLIYDPAISGNQLSIVCFVSGSGTNYERIVMRNPNHNYLVFTNRPGCSAVDKARKNNHPVIELSHIPYLKRTRQKYGSGSVPRNCPERLRYEQDAWKLIEEKLRTKPDLICLAGYDQWVTDWTVDRYYPKILNVHPGDTTKGYDGLYWIPTAKAILAGDKDIRSTLFLVDNGEDTGPVLVQSAPLNIEKALAAQEGQGTQGLLKKLQAIMNLTGKKAINDYEQFVAHATTTEKDMMQTICENLQEALKETGDWQIYPFAVHDLIAKGRVAVDGRKIYIDSKLLPQYGYRLD